MADGIIDITHYLQGEPGKEPPKGAFALWGADGERSRFALPLWRIIYLSNGGRGAILSRADGGEPKPFVVLDLMRDPPDLAYSLEDLPGLDDSGAPALVDRGEDGLVVHLGRRHERVWSLVVDGGGGRPGPLEPHVREDVLFLAGECAGLLFLRDFAADLD